MASKKVKVIYLDGREELVKVPPRAQVMTEEHCNGFKHERAILAGHFPPAPGFFALIHSSSVPT